MIVQTLATMLQREQAVPPFPVYSENISTWRQMSEALHMSFYRVLSLLVAVLPGILACFVALVVFALIGMVASAFMRWLLRLVRFDERVARTGAGADWSPSTSPTALAARLTFWAFVFLGVLVGVSAFDASYTAVAALSFALLPYVTHLVGAVFILVLGALIARFLARSVLIGAVNAQVQYARLLSLGVKWLVLVLTAAMVLEHLDIGGVIVELAFSILFGGIVLTLALAVGPGSRQLVSRSLESQLERERTPAPPNEPTETIRHF